MAILTNIVAADEDEIEAIGESLHPLDVWSGIEMRDMDTAKIATLHCLLTGDLFDDAIGYYEPVYVSAVEGALVLCLTSEVKGRLAEVNEEALEAIAAELSATQEFEYAGWEDEAVAAMLTALAELARLADAQEQSLFVWMHPLRT